MTTDAVETTSVPSIKIDSAPTNSVPNPDLTNGSSAPNLAANGGDGSSETSRLHDDSSTSSTPALATPPDGGWGWMVVFASFLIHVIADGVAYSFGVFLDVFADYFNSSHGSTSLLSSLMIGVTWGSGPIVSALTNLYGCRVVTMAGAVVAFCGFIMSIFAPNIYFMYFSFGIVSGFGLGLIYVPAIVSVTFYFEKKRSFATGIAVCGSGIGTFIFGPVTEMLLNHYGSWKSAVLIEAALLLNCVLCGALFRPLPAPRKEKKAPALEMEDFSSGDLKSSKHRKSSTTSLPHDMLLADQEKPPQPKGVLSVKEAQQFASDFLLNKSHEKDESTTTRKRSPHHLRPLDRKDIFYSGSLRNIPLYNEDPAEYARSMLSIHDTDSTSSARSQSCLSKLKSRLACRGSGMSWKEILDFSILKDPIFIMFTISNILTSLGFCVPYVFLPDRARLMGCSRQQGAILIAIIGMSNTIGRVVFGWISDRPGVNRLLLYSTVLVLCGLSTAGSSLAVNYPLLGVYAALFGCFLGVYVSITSVVLVDLMGLEKLTSAFGILLLFQGIAAVLGPPIAGSVYDLTHDYDASFYLMGAMIILSGIMLYPIPFIQRRQNKDPATDERERQLGKNSSSHDALANRKVIMETDVVV